MRTDATPETSHADHAKATWDRICKAISQDIDFGEQRETLVEIATLFTQFEILFSEDKAQRGKAKASEVFGQLKALADKLHATDPNIEHQHEYFVKLDTIWPSGLDSRWFLGFNSSRTILENLSSKYFARDHQHPPISNATAFGYGLLRIFYNLLLLHANFQVFTEVNREMKVTRNAFIHQLHSTTNQSKAQTELEASLTACQIYVKSKSAGKEDQQQTAPSRNNSVGDRDRSLRIAQALIIIDKVHTYLQRRKEETTATKVIALFLGYSKTDLDARQACFNKVIRQIANPDNRESHREMLEGFIRHAISGFEASTRFNRQDFYDGMRDIATAIGNPEFSLSDFQAAVEMLPTTAATQAVTAAVDTDAQASASSALRMGGSSSE